MNDDAWYMLVYKDIGLGTWNSNSEKKDAESGW